MHIVIVNSLLCRVGIVSSRPPLCGLCQKQAHGCRRLHDLCDEPAYLAIDRSIAQQMDGLRYSLLCVRVERDVFAARQRERERECVTLSVLFLAPILGLFHGMVPAQQF